MAGRITLLWCNGGQMHQGQSMRTHSHACVQLYYVLSGSPVFNVAGLRFTAPAGSFFYVPRSAPHSMEPLGQEGAGLYEFKLICEDKPLAEGLREPALPLADGGAVRTLLEYVMRNSTAGDEANAANIESILTAVMLAFLAPGLDFKAKGSRYVIADGFDAVTREVLVYAERHFPNAFTMEALSKALNYSRNYLSTVFRRNTGRTVIEYLNLLRIRKAVICFYYYGQDVSSTCESAGFTELSYFSRTFRKYTGVSPRRFKRALSSPGALDPAAAELLEPITGYNRVSMEEAFASLRRLRDFCDAALDERPAKE